MFCEFRDPTLPYPTLSYPISPFFTPLALSYLTLPCPPLRPPPLPISTSLHPPLPCPSMSFVAQYHVKETELHEQPEQQIQRPALPLSIKLGVVQFTGLFPATQESEIWIVVIYFCVCLPSGGSFSNCRTCTAVHGSTYSRGLSKVLNEYCRLPAIVTVRSLGTDGNNQKWQHAEWCRLTIECRYFRDARRFFFVCTIYFGIALRTPPHQFCGG